MSYASEVSRLNDDVQGGSGRKFRGGRVTQAFEETFPANVGVPRDIAFDPSTGTHMIVGAQMIVPNTSITVLLRNPANGVWSFKPGIPTNPAFGLGGRSIVANNGRYIVGAFSNNPGPVFWWTDDLGATFTAGLGVNTTDPVWSMLATNENVYNTLISGFSGQYAKSIDNGKNWTVFGGGGAGNQVSFLNEFGNIHALRDTPPQVWKSVDGGLTWALWPCGFVGWTDAQGGLAWNGHIGGPIIATGQINAGAPPRALIALSRDSGQTMQIVTNPRNIALNSICMLPNETFLAAGDNRGDGKPYVTLGSTDGLTWKDIDVPTARLSDIIKIRYLNGRVWFVGRQFGNANGIYSMHPSAFFF